MHILHALVDMGKDEVAGQWTGGIEFNQERVQ